MTTDFCDRFVTNFPLAYCWFGLKLLVHPTVEFHDKEVGFSWRAYRNLGNGFTYVDSMMGHFLATVEIIYLVATNVGWLPYLADEGIWYVHYSAHRVRR